MEASEQSRIDQTCENVAEYIRENYLQGGDWIETVCCMVNDIAVEMYNTGWEHGYHTGHHNGRTGK